MRYRHKIMISHLAVSAAALFVCVVVGAGFYIGTRHVETMSQLPRNRERPDWAQESVDTFNRIVGRPVSPTWTEDTLAGEDTDSETDSEEQR